MLYIRYDNFSILIKKSRIGVPFDIEAGRKVLMCRQETERIFIDIRSMKYSQLSLGRTPSGSVPTVRLVEVSAL